MRRFVFPATVAAIAALVTAFPAYAASNVLTVGSTSGPAVASGDTLKGDLKPGTSAVFQSTGNSTRVTCTTSHFEATVDSNPAPPGPASLTLTILTFGNCTINVMGASVSSVTVDHLPYNVSVASPNGGNNLTISPGTSGSIQTTVKIVSFGITSACTYHVHDASGDIFGKTDNTDNSLTFTSQLFDKTSGPSICVAQAGFNATYVVVDWNQGNGPLFTN